MTNLHTLNARGLLEADYRDATTYETRGISLHETGLIFNYPDGNDHHLARWASHDVSDPSGPRWRLSLYSRTSGQNRGHLQESQDR